MTYAGWLTGAFHLTWFIAWWGMFQGMGICTVSYWQKGEHMWDACGVACGGMCTACMTLCKSGLDTYFGTQSSGVGQTYVFGPAVAPMAQLFCM